MKKFLTVLLIILLSSSIFAAVNGNGSTVKVLAQVTGTLPTWAFYDSSKVITQVEGKQNLNTSGSVIINIGYSACNLASNTTYTVKCSATKFVSSKNAGTDVATTCNVSQSKVTVTKGYKASATPNATTVTIGWTGADTFNAADDYACTVTLDISI